MFILDDLDKNKNLKMDRNWRLVCTILETAVNVTFPSGFQFCHQGWTNHSSTPCKIPIVCQKHSLPVKKRLSFWSVCLIISIYSSYLFAHAVLCKITVDVISVQYLLITYRESPTTFIQVMSKWIRCIFIILHRWWCFSHNLDMV